MYRHVKDKQHTYCGYRFVKVKGYKAVLFAPDGDRVTDFRTLYPERIT